MAYAMWSVRLSLFLAWLCLRAGVWCLSKAGRFSWRINFPANINLHIVNNLTALLGRADILRLAWQYPTICDAHKELALHEPTASEQEAFFPWRRSAAK
jgi:hypothetical protein